jgi:hypothetical protein
MSELDALQQRAADNSLARLALLLDAIEISAQAADLEEEGKKEYAGARRTIAEHLKYSTNTVTKLAAMHALPDDCIDLNLKPGTYWVVLLHADAPVEFLRQRAIPEQMTPGQAKKALGVEVVRESRLTRLEAELDKLREERQEIAAWLINEVQGFGSDIVEGVRMLLERLRQVENGP